MSETIDTSSLDLEPGTKPCEFCQLIVTDDVLSHHEKCAHRTNIWFATEEMACHVCGFEIFIGSVFRKIPEPSHDWDSDEPKPRAPKLNSVCLSCCTIHAVGGTRELHIQRLRKSLRNSKQRLVPPRR